MDNKENSTREYEKLYDCIGVVNQLNSQKQRLCCYIH